MTLCNNPYFKFFNVDSDEGLELCLIKAYESLEALDLSNYYKHKQVA